jgi:DNA-binding transcriptional ArsR family regulator
MGEVKEAKLAKAALDQTANEDKMQEALSGAVKDLFAGLSPQPLELTERCKNRIAALAMLTARCRSGVERDSRSRDISLIPQAEAPGRLAKQLRMLFQGMLAIGATEEDAHAVLTRIALDSMPPLRRAVFEVLRLSITERTTAEIAEAIGYPEQTARRALEDLEAHRVLIKRPMGSVNALYWSLSDWAKARWTEVARPFPEMSGGERKE